MFVVISELDAVAPPRTFHSFVSSIYPDIWATECDENAGSHVGAVLIYCELDAQCIIEKGRYHAARHRRRARL
jgi:hypothetical protein